MNYLYDITLPLHVNTSCKVWFCVNVKYSIVNSCLKTYKQILCPICMLQCFNEQISVHFVLIVDIDLIWTVDVFCSVPLSFGVKTALSCLDLK